MRGVPIHVGLKREALDNVLVDLYSGKQIVRKNISKICHFLSQCAPKIFADRLHPDHRELISSSEPVAGFKNGEEKGKGI